MKKTNWLFQVFVLCSVWAYTQNVGLTVDLINETPGSNASFAEFNNSLYYNSNSISGISGAVNNIYRIDANGQNNFVFNTTATISNLVAHGNFLYFTVNANGILRIGRIDTVGNFEVVSATYAAYEMFSFNGELYFAGEANKTDTATTIAGDLYAYNENTDSFRLVDTNFNYGMGLSDFVVHNNELYFFGEVAAATFENALYKTNGTSISQVVTYNTEILGTNRPQHLTSFAGDLYFSGIVDVSNFYYRLFRVNTTLNTLFSVPNYLGQRPVVFNGSLYYVGLNETNPQTSEYEFLRYDPFLNSSTIIPISAANGSVDSLNFTSYGILNNSLLFVLARTPSVGFELFALRNGQLELFEDLNPGTPPFVNPNAPLNSQFKSFGDKLFVIGERTNTSSQFFTNIYEISESLCIETVDIEDPNFETYIENILGAGDGIFGNKKVCRELVETVTSISISGLNIADLTGIAAFRDLEFIEASSNQLSNVDLSANTNLASIDLSDNQLTALDVSSNIDLFALLVNNNQITSLDLSNNSKLVEVKANGNSLQTVNINGLTKLENIQLSSNQLSGSLDFSAQNELFQLRLDDNLISNLTLPASARMESLFVSNNPNLASLDVSVIPSTIFDIFEATNLPALDCIQVLDVNEANNKVEWTKDTTTTYSLNCGATYTLIPDTNFEQALIDQNIDSEGTLDGQVLTSDITDETILNLTGISQTPLDIRQDQGLGISNMAGIEDFAALEELYVQGELNTFSTLNLSNNSNLRILYGFFNSSLNNLNVNGLTNLQTVGVNFCGLTNVDFSSNTGLVILNITDNALTQIQLPNTNSFNILTIANNNILSSLDVSSIDENLTTLQATGLSALSCIQVSDVTNANAQAGWTKDATTQYSLDCGNQPYTVLASITNAGTSPNYTIQEGQTFNLNFNADATASNGTVYNPVIAVTQNGLDTTADFTIDDLNRSFTVSGTNPDGSIQFTPLDDGNTTGDEVYTITIASENTGQYTIAQPTSFTITVTDDPQSNDTVFLSATVEGADFDGQNYSITEGNFFQILIESSNGTDDELVLIPITFIKDGEFDFDFIYEGDNPIELTVNNNQNPDVEIEIGIVQDLSVTNEGSFLEIFLRKPDGNYEWADNNGSVNKNIQIFIKDREEYSGDPFVLEATLGGDVEMENGTYFIDEGEDLQVNINDITPNDADGFQFEVQYRIEGSVELQSDNPLDLTIDNGSNPDGTINIAIPIDGLDNTDKTLRIILDPEANGNYSWQDGLEDTDGSGINYGQREFTVTVRNVIQDGVFATLTNRGGTEGHTQDDEITLTLINGDGDAYVNDTGNAVIFPLIFSSEGLAQPAIRDEDYIPSSDEIVIPNGSSSGSITVRYPEEPNDDDNPDFYTVSAGQPTQATIPNLQLPNPLEIKILDDEGIFDVFLTLVEDNLTLTDDTGSGCCPYYFVEEGEIIVYEFNAEKGVPEGTKYTIELDMGGGVSNPLGTIANATENQDFLLTTSNPEQRVFEFEANDDFLNPNGFPDNRLLIRIPNNDETGEPLEGFNVFFKEADVPNNENFSLKTFSAEFVIEEPVFASIQSSPSQNVARENPLAPAAFVVTISEVANSDRIILYQIEPESGATQGEDFEMVSGEVIIPQGELTASIIITPINDIEVEANESVVLKLIDGSGYALTADDTAQIIIESDDIASFEVSLTTEDNVARENNPDDLAELVFTRTGLNNSTFNEPLTINFSADNQQILEGSDYEILDSDGSTILIGETKSIIIPAGNDSVRAFVRAIDDDIEESTETIIITLNNGSNYTPSSSNNAVEIDLISDEIDGSSFDARDIDFEARSPTCAGSDQRGSIYIENNTGFEFEVRYKQQGQTDFNEGIILNKNSVTNGNFVEIPDLPIGKYEVTLGFTENNEEVPTDIILPSYVISINELSGIESSRQSMDLDLKTIDFTVSGSDFYSVTNNGKKYEFDFENDGENNLKIPLETGNNDIVILGKAECLGKIESNILFNQLKAYPNPTDGFLELNGLTIGESYQLIITDVKGSVLYRNSMIPQNQSLPISLENYQQGIYHLLVITKNSASNLKIIKK